MGKLSDFAKKPSRTPELTNIGSFEKCWRYENGAWWMHKAENGLERFSELFVYELCKALNFPTAVYHPSGNFIKTIDFTGGTLNYEPVAYLMGDNRDYASNYRMFQRFGQNIADSYVEIILMDTFCCNVDRHTYNYGLLRDRGTGDIVSLAPNFDNNIALISGEYDDGLERSNLLIGLLNEFEQQTHAVADYLTRHKVPVITKDMICVCCDATGIPFDTISLHGDVQAGFLLIPERAVSPIGVLANLLHALQAGEDGLEAVTCGFIYDSHNSMS